MEEKRRLPCNVCYLRLSCTASQDRAPPPPESPAKGKKQTLVNLLPLLLFFGGFIGIPFSVGFLLTRVTNSESQFAIPAPLVIISPSPSPSPLPVLTTGSKSGLATK